jgi:hypothetical protein
MRSILFVVAMSATASANSAALPPLDVGSLPSQCRVLAREPHSATTLGPRLAAYTSVASCMATARLRELSVSPTQASVDAMNAAIATSIALYDAVIQNGDVKDQLFAEYAKADLYSGVNTRLLASVSAPDNPASVNQAMALGEAWRVNARDGYHAVAQLGVGTGLATTDPMVAYEVRDSQRSQSSGIATR